jgi:hypothetical protein
MYVYIIIALAAVFNAVMDLLENENFFESFFARFNQQFFYKRESWKYAKKILGYKVDGWHIAKSVAICLLLIPAAENWIQWLALGLIWNLVFVGSYKLLKWLK